MSLHRNLLLEYPNPTFVETGSYHGDAIQYAFEAEHFSKIISIEKDPYAYNFCQRRFDTRNRANFPDQFKFQPEIKLILGDSATCLWDAIKDIAQPITFWLDSHYQMLEGEEKGENPFPLLQELEQIARHSVKTHTILIDDMLIMQNDIVGYNKQDVESAVLKINPAYKISFRANPVIGGILVAQI